MEEKLFGDLLAYQRKIYGLSRRELAARAGISVQTVVRAERGENISMVTVVGLCDAFCLSYGQMTGRAPIEEGQRMKRQMILTLHQTGAGGKRTALLACQEIGGETDVEAYQKKNPYRKEKKNLRKCERQKNDIRKVQYSGTGGCWHRSQKFHPQKTESPKSQSDLDRLILEKERWKTLGMLVRTLRRQKGLTQGKFAACCGLTQATISKIENGRTIPTLRSLAAMARVLRTNLDTLLENCLMAFKKVKLRGLINAVLFRLLLLDEGQMVQLLNLLEKEWNWVRLPRQKGLGNCVRFPGFQMEKTRNRHGQMPCGKRGIPKNKAV